MRYVFTPFSSAAVCVHAHRKHEGKAEHGHLGERDDRPLHGPRAGVPSGDRGVICVVGP